MVIAASTSVGYRGHGQRLQNVSHVRHAHLDGDVAVRAAVVHLRHPRSGRRCVLQQPLAAIKLVVQPVLLVPGEVGGGVMEPTDDTRRGGSKRSQAGGGVMPMDHVLACEYLR